MQNYTLPSDIKTFCVQAKTFPEGIVEAHKKLHSLVPPSNTRRYFGIAVKETKEQMVYYAAAEELSEGEAEKYNCKTFIISAGEYISVRIDDFHKDIPSIARTFKELRSEPRIDPNGASIEMYLNEKDILCMMKLK